MSLLIVNCIAMSYVFILCLSMLVTCKQLKQQICSYNLIIFSLKIDSHAGFLIWPKPPPPPPIPQPSPTPPPPFPVLYPDFNAFYMGCYV